jgi:Alr-MurF fusion protein
MISIDKFVPQHGELVQINNAAATCIDFLAIDSRNIMYAEQALFVAIRGQVQDGHAYIQQAYAQGVRNFLLSDTTSIEKYDDVNYIKSNEVVATLQNMAATHRSKFTKLKSIGITGSNGKTIVKEWLSIILSKKYQVVKTPKSFNSQIGVPLSVWPLNDEHEVGIFEAGISTKEEMSKLEKIIQPSIGILTNIGDAHNSGFSNKKEKIEEKLKLFIHSDVVVFNGDDHQIRHAISHHLKHVQQLSWGYESHNHITIVQKETNDHFTNVTIELNGEEKIFSLEYSNSVYFENIMHCIVTELHLGMSDADISESFTALDSIEMRLQLLEGKDGSTIINDSYTNDLNALTIALSFMQKHAGQKHKLLILSELEHYTPDVKKEIMPLLLQHAIDEIFLVGSHWQAGDFKAYKHQVFANTNEVKRELVLRVLSNNIILLKGARKYKFEELKDILTTQSHSVTLEIDLNAIEHNLSVFASLLKNETRIVPIIKASAYGTGSHEIAKLLQHKGAYALGVAFADEGVQLRKAGITIPIIVLNSDEESYHAILEYNMEVEVYSLSKLESILSWNNGALKEVKMHLKLDTGMSRLGFRNENMDDLYVLLQKHKPHVASIFTHMSSSEDPQEDIFSHEQVQKFDTAYTKLCEVLAYHPKRHVLNSSGIIRFPEYHYELVRLGLGLYGIDSTGILADKLEKVHTLKARIIQIKTLNPGDFVGYNRKYKVTKNTTIAILNIGYADGLLRLCGNNNYHVGINDTTVPIIGSVCMDLTMIDITNINHVQEGDEVVVFGKNLPIENMAVACGTIPYEILCRLAPRIVRKYVF